jgi:branched-chain amino acid transport system permease protein
MKRQTQMMLVLIAALALVPMVVTSKFWMGFWVMMLFHALMGQSWNILGGYGGQTSYGHAVFFGTGAYVTAVMQTHFGFNAWAAALVAIAAGGGVGLFIGAVSFRYGLRGSYFALVTLAFAEVFRVVVNAWDFTGSGFGMLLTLKPGFAHMQFADRQWFFYLILVLTIFATGIALWLESSRFGAHLVAIRENEDAAKALGINTFEVKLKAIGISAALAAVGGVFYMQYFLFVDSHIGYGPSMSVSALLVPLIGGPGTVLGPFIGSLSLGVLSEITKHVMGDAPGANLLAYGVLLLVVLRFLPNGLMGLFRGRS